MSARKSPSTLTVVLLLGMVFGSRWAPTLLAQTPSDTDQSKIMVKDLLLRVHTLENELRDVRQRQEAMINPLPTATFDFVSDQNATTETNGSQAQNQTTDQLRPECGGESCGCHGRCYSCQVPLTEAPCIDCPRVSTLRPFNNLHFFGAMKLDMIFSDPRPLSPGSPFFLSSGSISGRAQNIVSIHARQSTLAAAFTGPQFGGLQSGGTIITLFFNDSVVADQYGILPLQAFGELKNEDWRFAAGLQFDVFSPGIPTVLPFSALAASGNTGNSFRGQLRLERFLRPSNKVQWTIQAAVSDPINSTIDPTFRIREDNGWPNVEARIALGLGGIEGAGLAARRPFELGVSGVVGQLRTTDPVTDTRVVADVWGLSTDFRWKLTDCWGIAGEAFTGQTLGTYNGGILQNINLDTLAGIRSSGGWIETFLYWTPQLHSHLGYGIDDPIDRDIADKPLAFGRTSNSTFFGNLLWDVTQVFRVGFEVTWRDTHYKALPDDEGVAFQTQFQWAF